MSGTPYDEGKCPERSGISGPLDPPHPLRVTELVKCMDGGQLVSDGVSLEVPACQVLALIGPNGAGKTSLLRQIVGLSRPTSGQIAITGVDVVENVGYARRACSLQPQSPLAFSALPIREALTLIGRLRGGRPPVVMERASELISTLKLEEWAESRIERLPGGIQRLVGFCLAIIVPGSVILLDEPTNDVDPLRRRLMWGEIRRVAETGPAVVVVTHNLNEVSGAVDRVAMMARGRIVAAGSPVELSARSGVETLEDAFMMIGAG